MRRHVVVVVTIVGALLASAHASVEVVILAVPDKANAAPSIAADGDRVAIAWGARGEAGTDVVVATSADGGRSFSSPVRVNESAGTARLGGELPPRLVITGGRVDVLWTARSPRTSILLARSIDGGRTFMPARALQQAEAPGDRGWPALAADAKGNVHAAWLDHRGGAGTHHASPDKSALVYNGGRGEVEITRSVCYCCKTAIATGAEGRVFTAWRHVYPGNIRDVAFSMSSDGGRTFAAPVRISEDRWQLDGCPDDGPAMAVDAAGVTHVVWPSVVDGPEPYKAIFHSWTRDGRSFTPRMRITHVGNNAAHPQVVAHSAGVTVLWDEVVDGQRRVFARRHSRSNSTFVPVALSDERAAASYPAAVVVGEEVVAAWVHGGGNDSRIAVKRFAIR